MKKINFFLAFVLYFSLQVTGCYNFSYSPAPSVSLPENCSWDIYNSKAEVVNSGRSNCTANGDVLTLKNPRTGNFDAEFNKANGTYRTDYERVQGKVTVDDDKYWRLYISGKIQIMVVLD